ncbi:MAG: type II toxin-antitoxin system RelE family toxin [Bacteroidota bacterium]
MYQLKIHKKVLKFLKTRKSSERQTIKSKIELLRENPYNHPQLDIKKLKGVNDTYRLRFGKLRIIYQVLENELLVLLINAGSRGDIYHKKP